MNAAAQDVRVPRGSLLCCRAGSTTAVLCFTHSLCFGIGIYNFLVIGTCAFHAQPRRIVIYLSSLLPFVSPITGVAVNTLRF